jgi:hypothetical protein
MGLPRASIERTVALVVAACSTTGCSMIGTLDLWAPVLPGTLVAILALLGGIFAVALSRYAHRRDTPESGGDGRSDNVA